MLLDSGDRMLAVLEDDVAVDPDLPRVLAAIEQAGPCFDQINLHRTPGRREFFSRCADLLPGWEVGRVGWTQIGTQGYVVTAAGAARILAGCRRLVLTQDNWTQRVWANGLDLYGLNRPAVEPLEDAVSTISETRRVREPMPAASSPGIRVARQMLRLGDSLAKRLHYPFFVWQGRRRLGHR
jgi:GR25 family glycosyltransferase involved in LPS biosynthesis